MFNFSRILIVYIIAVFLAVILGYLVVWPSAFSLGLIGLVLLVMALPLFFKWHHALLIIFWNSAFMAFFLPGQPDIWVVLAAASFCVSFLNYIMFQKPFLSAPELARPLIFLGVVVLATAWYRGGIGIRALGGAAFGGRYYVYILGAILGYFALTAQPIPLLKGRKMASLFFLSGATNALSNIIFVMGPSFYFLYFLVSTGAAVPQAASAEGLTSIDRIEGLAATSTAGLCFLLGRYGIRGLFDWSRPWRFALLCLTVGAAFFAGFRSIIIVISLIFAFQFYFEGLIRTPYFPVIIGLFICGMVPVLVFADKMPAAVQRSISFLPVNVNAEILRDAQGSSEWRLQMWAVVWKEVPKYLLIGKGYSINPDDIYAVTEAARMGLGTSDFEGSMLVGDYHSGPLSILVPFGVFGVLGFIWVLYAGGRVLYANYRFGDRHLRLFNTVLLSYYLTNCICFFFIFGAFNSQLAMFLGICGFSVSLNKGVRKRSLARSKPVVRLRSAEPVPG